MRIRTYSFDDIKKGMETIKQQYGPDTIIMDIKQNQLNGNGWAKKKCEISIGIEDRNMLIQDDYLMEIRRGTEAVWQHTTRYLSDRLNSMESEMIRDRLRTYPISVKVLFDKMVKNGFDMYLALELVSEVYAQVGTLVDNSIKALFFLKDAVAKRIKTTSVINEMEPLVIVGPSGSGKTETVKKLSRSFFEKEIPVSVIGFDPVKRSSYDDLAVFSESTGVPCQFSTDPDDLCTKIKVTAGKIFVDVSGHADVQKELSERLTGIKKIIVLAAGYKDEKNMNYVRLFQGGDLAGVVFTKLDEEVSLGSVCTGIIRLDQPVCCMTKGTRSGDILPYNKETFSRMLIEGAI